MDKAWMMMNRLSREYEEGVQQFLHFATQNVEDPKFMLCPCAKCANLSRYGVNIIKAHLFRHGMDQTYHKWIWHGERCLSSESVQERDQVVGDVEDPIDMVHDAYDTYEDNPSQFRMLLEDAEKPLYAGCSTFTKLSAIVKLYNLKARYCWSDTSFSDLLSLLGEMLPEPNELPLSLYEAKKNMYILGMSYEKIHACPNDCILYRKEYEGLIECPTCGVSRWKVGRNSMSLTGIPAKVLWAMNIFNAGIGKKPKKHHTWEVIKGPIQPDSKQCGFFCDALYERNNRWQHKKGSDTCFLKINVSKKRVFKR